MPSEGHPLFPADDDRRARGKAEAFRLVAARRGGVQYGTELETLFARLYGDGDEGWAEAVAIVDSLVRISSTAVMMAATHSKVMSTQDVLKILSETIEDDD